MIKNSVIAYGVVSRALHWMSALTVFFLFGLGLYMVDLSYYDAWYKSAPDLHRSIGLCLFLITLVRMAWRRISPPPAPIGRHDWELKIAHVVHLLLIGLLLLTLLAGYLISTADGRGISVFGLFELPALLPAEKGREEWSGTLHQVGAWSLIGLVVLHVLAALKHHWIDRDETLRRMLGLKLKTSDEAESDADR
ncbi:MAG: cytochrome b [Hahellaceae bacterium]|nr:cytochrome b [Hahellaceae bacterium]